MNINKVSGDLKQAKKLKKEFGFAFALKSMFYKYTHRTDNYIENSVSVLRPYVQESLHNYKTPNCNNKMPSNIPVWMFWWQGYNMMPEIVQKCYESVRYNLPEGTTLFLLTKDNFDEFTSIPQSIVDKVNRGIYSITLFSDLLRNQLLSIHGGMWIDATVYCANPLPYDFFACDDFWSVKLHPDFNYDKYSIGRTVTKRMWGGFIQKASPNSRINSIVYDVLSNYMIEHDVLVDYFIQNIVIRLLYECDSDVKRIIDKIPFSNPRLYDLAKTINCKYEEEVWNEMKSETTFFKLSWKEKYNKKDDAGLDTYYGFLTRQE